MIGLVALDIIHTHTRARAGKQVTSMFCSKAFMLPGVHREPQKSETDSQDAHEDLQSSIGERGMAPQ